MRTNIGLAAAVLASGLVARAMGATIDAGDLPYAPSTTADFTMGATGSGGTWSAFENTIWDGVGSSSSTAVVNTDGVAGQNFTVKTDFQVKNYNGGTFILGVSALADSESQGGDWSANKFYTALVRFDAATNGSLDICTNNPGYYGSSLVTGGAQAGAWVAANTVENTYNYTLTMNGAYDGAGNLTLSATVVDLGNPANSLAVSSQQIAAGDIGTGTNFGLRTSAYWGGGKVEFSNFAITNAVPEPVSLSFVLLGGMGLMSRRRKSA